MLEAVQFAPGALGFDLARGSGFLHFLAVLYFPVFLGAVVPMYPEVKHRSYIPGWQTNLHPARLLAEKLLLYRLGPYPFVVLEIASQNYSSFETGAINKPAIVPIPARWRLSHGSCVSRCFFVECVSCMSAIPFRLCADSRQSYALHATNCAGGFRACYFSLGKSQGRTGGHQS